MIPRSNRTSAKSTEPRNDGKEIARIVACKAAPVLEIGMPFEARRMRADAVNPTSAIGQQCRYDAIGDQRHGDGEDGLRDIS